VPETETETNSVNGNETRSIGGIAAIMIIATESETEIEMAGIEMMGNATEIEMGGDTESEIEVETTGENEIETEREIGAEIMITVDIEDGVEAEIEDTEKAAAAGIVSIGRRKW